MSNWQTRLAAAGAALCLLGGAAGCGKQKAMTIGTVDTVALVQSDPDYQKMAVDYLKERASVQEKTQKLVRTAPQSEATRKTIENLNKELDKKWFEKTQKFLDARFQGIQGAAEAICKEKDIDLVLVDTSNYPTVEYGAVNITQDVELKLQQGGGAKQ
ncbi:MAG: hypothetical protein AB1758_06195 [Candidatus Eremiobacterota bacterium]